MKSKMPFGYRPVNRIANSATIQTTTTPTQRKNSTTKCGMTRSHFTSQSHRLNGSSSRPARSTGSRVTGAVAAAAGTTPGGGPGTNGVSSGGRGPPVARCPAATIMATPPASRITPTTKMPATIAHRCCTWTPTETSALTPRLASAFITRTV